jgi:ABC-type transport system substrate-binding protein
MESFMKRSFAAFVFGLCLSAQVVQESFSRDPGPLDFIRGEGLEQFILQSLTGDALVGVDASGAVVARLSPRWEIRKASIRFELRADARFTDGSQVRPADVIWTFQAIQADPIASPTKRSILQGTRVWASGTGVEISSAKPAQRLLMELASLSIAKQGQPAMGSGPFWLEGKTAPWNLKARTHFLHPRIPGLQFRLLPDEQAILQNLEKGWLSIGVPPTRKDLKPPPSHTELHQPTPAQVIVWSRIGTEPLRLLETWRGNALPAHALGTKCSPSRGLWPEALGFSPCRIQSHPGTRPTGGR